VEGKDGGYNNPRLNQGKHDGEKDPESTGTVQAGGLFERDGNGREKLLEEKDDKGKTLDTPDNPQPPFVYHSDLTHEKVEGHNGNHEGNHHGGKNHQKYGFILLYLKPGESVSGETAAENAGDGVKHGKYYGVHEISAEIDLFPGYYVVLPLRILGKDIRRESEELGHGF
jgi:hypothetical protein